VPRLTGLQQSDFLLFGVAFILGLLLTGNPFNALGILGIGATIALLRWRWGFVFRPWGSAPMASSWGMATIIALLAMLYFYLRVPQPAVNDISRLIPRLRAIAPAATVRITGKIIDTPLLNRSGKQRFFLDSDRYELIQGPDFPLDFKGIVSGKVYVTLPAAEAKGLHPSQTIAVTGRLYQPPESGSGKFYRVFDFGKYLRSQAAFAGLTGWEAKILDRGSPWGWWAVRERISQAQLQTLGTPAGPVLSAMVLGSRAVAIPFEISDQFRRVGLAHALAASGFQTSLLLSAVLVLTRSWPERQQLLLGGGTLLLFGGLSGFAPSVMRAVLMGIAGLVALVGNQKARPVPLLLFIALVLLLVNPLWIEDLGFQFSFLATLGLLVSAPPIAKALDVLPSLLASLIAVPVAAMIWVLPIQLMIFGVFPPYGLLANLLSSLLLSVITIGGFISGLIALVWPLLGGWVAWVMSWPILSLLGMIRFLSHLPGSSLAIGAISLAQVLGLYGLMVAVWLIPWWQRRWPVAMGIALGLVVLPFLQLQTTGFRVTVLESNQPPMMVIQEPGANILINAGDPTTAAQRVSSFLSLQGINQIDWAIASDRRLRYQRGWVELQKWLPIRVFSDLPLGRGNGEDRVQLSGVKHSPFQLNQEIVLGSTRARLVRADPVVLQLQIRGQNWLLVNDPRGSAGDQAALRSTRLPATDVLWWAGVRFPPELIQRLKPKEVIFSTDSIDPGLLTQLTAQKIQVFWTERDGAVQWTSEGGFTANLEPQD
jgi:competence protein ComEC